MMKGNRYICLGWLVCHEVCFAQLGIPQTATVRVRGLWAHHDLPDVLQGTEGREVATDSLKSDNVKMLRVWLRGPAIPQVIENPAVAANTGRQENVLAGVACRSDADCALAGRCDSTSGLCHCVPPFAGVGCAQLSLRPMRYPAAFSLRHDWTWGGSVIQGDGDGRYHMFVMHLANHCGIQCYQSNGQVLHVVTEPGAGPEGPYSLRALALGPRPGFWDGDTISEPHIQRHPDGTYLLFYMGLNDTHSAFNCTLGDTRCMGIGGKRMIGVAFSKSLDGPWERLDKAIVGPGPAGQCDDHDVSNPAVVIHSNGSVLIGYKGENHGRPGCIAFATAPTWRGPYTRPRPDLALSGLRACEDPYIWIDRKAIGSRLVYRMLTHSCIQPGLGGHFFSTDGLQWQEAYTNNITWAYNSNVALEGRGTLHLERRERPQVLLSSDGSLQCVFNSAQPCKGTWGDQCRSHTIAACVDPPIDGGVLLV